MRQVTAQYHEQDSDHSCALVDGFDDIGVIEPVQPVL
jgi:hypothetical protein